MKVLAFDTCFDACSAAVLAAGQITAERELMTRGHAETLVPMIDRVMQRAHVAYADLDLIVVTHGPGTFTGTRVGIAAARGFSLAWNIPVATQSSLEPVALACHDLLGAAAGDRRLMMARDARRGRVFAQLFSGAGKVVQPPELLELEAAVELANANGAIVAGSGAELMAGKASERRLQIDTLEQHVDVLPDGVFEPDARDLLWAYKGNQKKLPTKMVAPRPLYLRPPDATPAVGKSIPHLAKSVR